MLRFEISCIFVYYKNNITLEKQTIMKIRSLLLLVFFIFATYAANAEKITLLTDIHVVPGNNNEKMLQEVINDINSNETELVVLSGDLTNEGSDEQLYNVKSLLDKITKPLFVIPGNHENNWSQSACKTFFDIWGNDRFVTVTDNLVIAGINCGPYMKMGDGHIKQEDLFWLDKTLSEHVKKGKQVLSICHYALNEDLDNYRDYVAVLKKYPVVAHLNGHYHHYKRYRVENIEVMHCRSLAMGKTFGYSIVDISADSVKLYEKTLNESAKLKYAYKIDVSTLQPLADAENFNTQVPDNFKIDLVHRDEASVFTRLAVDKNNVYFGNSLGYIKSVSKYKGKENWSYKTAAGLFSRPAVSKNVLIVPTADKRLLWLNSSTGELVNEYPAQGAYVADGIIQGNVLYQGGYKVFQAWDVKKQEMLWEYNDLKNYCQASPAIYKDNVVFGAWDTNLRVLDKDGHLKWSWNNGKSTNLYSPGNCVPVIANGKVIIVAPDRYMTALDLSSGMQIWRDKSHRYRESLGRSVDGKRVYAKTMDGEVVCVSTEGNVFYELWTVDAGLGYEHAPCIVLEQNGVVYAGSRRGIIAAIDAKTNKLLWRQQIGSSEVNGFEVDDKGDVYLSLIEGTIWRISKTK